MTEFAYNSATHIFTKISSFEVMLDYLSRMSWEDFIDKRSRFKSIMKHAENLKKLMIMLKVELHNAQAIQTKYKNKHIKVIDKYNVSDMIYLNDKNIRIKRNKKLEWKLFEFFEITHVIDEQAYRLKLSSQWRVHDVFHISLLKKNSKKKNATELSYQQNDIEIEKNETNEFYEVNDIIDSKIYDYDKVSDKKFSDSDLYYLIDWADCDSENRTWKSVFDIKHLRDLLRAFHKKHFDKFDVNQMIKTNRLKKRIEIK